MTNLLIKIFLKSTDFSSPSTRAACGKLAGLVGILCNVLLFAGKLTVGLLSGSVAVTADSLNSLTDASSAVVTLLGFKLAEKPADDGHPYGHARMEYLSGLLVAVLILLLGAELAKSSFTKILHPEPVSFTGITAVVLIASILLKLWLAAFCRTLGHRIDSSALLAAAADSRNDVIATAAVLVSGLLNSWLHWNTDGFFGLAVAVFILYSGYGLIRETIDPLLGAAPNPSLVRMIGDTILTYEKVLGIHDLIVHDYGPGQRFASVHVEMDSQEDPLVCHDIIDTIERDFMNRYHLHLVVHYDPLVTTDAELNHLRTIVEKEIRAIDPRLSIHDFRIVRSPKRTKLFFDLTIPFDMKSQEQYLKRTLDHRVQKEKRKYLTVITFDYETFHS